MMTGGALLSYDTETTGLSVHRGDRMFSFSVCDQQGAADVYRLDGSPVRRYMNRTKLEEIFSKRGPTLVCHNAKFDLMMTGAEIGWHVIDRPFHDTYIQSHIIRNNHPSHGLKELCWELAGIPKEDERVIRRYLRGTDMNYSHVPEIIMDDYQKRDAERTMLLHRFYMPKIESNPKFLDVYRNELDLIRASIDIERRGMMLDQSRCHKLIDKTRDDVYTLLQELEAKTGRKLNLNRPSDLHWLLFDHLKLPVLRTTTKTSKPSTDKETLFNLRRDHYHPLIDSVLKFRSWTRGITTLESYLDHCDGGSIIHPSLNTCAADTGRESCSSPNLQNVAKTGVLLNPFPVPARSVFRPRPGYILIFIDFSGIEFRLAVHYSQDQFLIKMIKDGQDPHALAAEIFFGDKFKNAIGDLRKTLRNAAKNMNFAIIYGAGLDTIAAGLGLPVSIVAPRYAEYKRRLPGLVGLSDTVSETVRSQGYVETIFGRRLYVPKDLAYIGTNYLIQGTAADILKRSQVQVHQYLKQATGGEVAILLPIHDELILEYPRKRLPDAPEILSGVESLMTNFPQFDVPMAVEFQVSTVDWENKKAYKWN